MVSPGLFIRDFKYVCCGKNCWRIVTNFTICKKMATWRANSQQKPVFVAILLTNCYA